ncbi:MAG TPA: hypothetical protein VFB62_02735 [Polyangiaceae bacterium]|nr:hypothetical protein [Polyangiaceae bacterium]
MALATAACFAALFLVIATAPRVELSSSAQAVGLSLPAGQRELVRVEREHADRDLKRGVQTMLPGGVLYIPPNFRSDDGRFDLLVHFHGNTELLEASVAEAGLNAILYIVNAGIGTRRYLDALSPPDALDELADRSARVAAEQGLQKARVRRVALSAWSAGFAAVGQILRHRPARVDAVLLMDGLHAPFSDEKLRVPDRRSMEPFLEFSDRAAAGERLFVITHSNIETYTYASTAQTAEMILGEQHLHSHKVIAKPLIAAFPAARRATPSHYHDGLVETSEAHKRGLQVRGFRGDRAEHHIAHLAQMSLTVLPPLVARWQKSTID